MSHMYNATMKLMLLAMAIAAVSSAALAEDEAPAQDRGRFLASFDEQAPISARRHLNTLSTVNLCGTGNKDQCQEKFNKTMKKPLCCKDNLGNSECFDTGVLLSKCGSCTNKCALGQICCDGTCVNSLSDPSKCGSCTHRCAFGQICCNGTCVNSLSDPSKCGSCTNKCAFGQICCDGTCVNSLSDPSKCGSCTNKCASGQICCNGLCVNSLSDPSKCGSCTNKCAFGQICCNGKCVNPISDPNNCGKCGTVCRGVSCVKSICGYNGRF